MGFACLHLDRTVRAEVTELVQASRSRKTLQTVLSKATRYKCAYIDLAINRRGLSPLPV